MLAAGRGERLRPLTDELPKPLLPVAGVPVAGRTLDRLAAAGCEAAALNLHHLGGLVRERFGDAWGTLPLTYSEEPSLLGTLGALGPLAGFLRPARRVVVVNGDSVCSWPLARLLAHHRRSGAAATLLLARRPDPEAFGGGVAVGRDGRILAFRRSGPAVAGEVAGRYVFAGAQVIEPGLLAGLGPGEDGTPTDLVRDLYEPYLMGGGRIAAVLTRRRWHDLGTARRYLEGALDAARGSGPLRLLRRGRVAADAEVARGARLRSAVVESGARIAAGARVERSIVLPGASVGPGAVVRGSIVGPAAAVPAGAWVERRLVTVSRGEPDLRSGESQVAGLLYTPLDAVPARSAG